VTTSCSPKALAVEPHESKAEAQKKLVEKLKVQWKLMWSERFDDKVRAEGISVSDYEVLFVERGTIIHATREFKALSFREIVEQHMVEDPDRFVQPDVHVGGWNKFIKTEITSHRPRSRKHAASYFLEKRPNKSEVQQLKKGGRGWLHTI
jgi:hypothetical protein